MLYDGHGRIVNYLRLAVTDRCNLRCYYCMPESGIAYIPRRELMTYEEMLRIVQILHLNGIRKVRITGGEPFLRKDFIHFLEELSSLQDLSIHITTNGTLISQHLDRLRDLGIGNINLSLDSLDKSRFHDITRRDDLNKVLESLHLMISKGFNLKINCVVIKNKNMEDIIPMVNLTKNNNITVRFLEEMPFNGGTLGNVEKHMTHNDILRLISDVYPNIKKLADPPNSTSYTYNIPGHKGNIGIIASYSRTFCDSCNRLRLTPTGQLKTCLYDEGVFNIKEFIRAGASDEQLIGAIQQAIRHKAINGKEAEHKRNIANNPVRESMSSIGG